MNFRWKKVGEVTDLLCYPIKSCGWIRLDEFNCEAIGIGSGNMGDRTFMVCNLKGDFVTARKYPNLTQVKPVVNDDVMALTAPGMPQILIHFNNLRQKKITSANVWDQEVQAIDVGDEVAKWFSKYILGEDEGLRVFYYPLNKPTRDVREKNKLFETTIPDDTGSLHDATSYMLINEGSIAELNSRLQKQVTPLRFRPNIVVKGPEAFAEDGWNWIKIGNNVTFQNVKPCTRCIFTNIDPESGERDANEEPLKTLKTYRKIEKGGDSPVMGIHLGLRGHGSIRVGEAVYVEDRS